MQFVFDEQKATEAAEHLLERAGGSLPYFTLIKLMYLADRRSLIETGFPITGDRMVSMPHGPALSMVLNRIKDARPGVRTRWRASVSPPSNYQVNLVQEPPAAGKLSRYEIRLLRETFDKYGHWPKWRLRAFTHRLPEYRDPHGSSLPIDPVAILQSEGKSPEQIGWRSELAASFTEIDKRHQRASA